MLLRRLAVASVATILSLSFPIFANADADSSRINALAWLFQHQNGDGSWGISNSKVQTTYAALSAISSANNVSSTFSKTHGNTYNSGLAWMASARPSSVDGMAFQLYTMFFNVDVPDRLYASLIGAKNNFNTWGSLPGYAFNAADTSVALITLYNAPGFTGLSYSDSGNVAICRVLRSQNPTNGGWTYLDNTPGAPATSSASVIPTSYALILNQMYIGNASITCSTTPAVTYTFATVANNGLAFLLTKQNADLGFGDNGTSGVLESALVYSAIFKINPNHVALSQIRTYLQNTQLSNGSWNNDALLTSYALSALPNTALTVSSSDGIPDVVKTVINGGLPFNPRDLSPGNGQGVVGSTAPTLLPQAQQYGTSYNYLLPGSGVFTLISGALPSGLTLNSDGTITGVATTAGSYVFTYQNSSGSTFVSRIDVVPGIGDIGAGDVPIPPWASIAMALMMFGIATFMRNRKG